MISRRRPTVNGDVNIRVEGSEDPDGRVNARKLVEEGMVETWERRWNLSQKCRHTYDFFPNVNSRPRVQWFVAIRYFTQMVTGHRVFREKLHRLGLVEEPWRYCLGGGI